MPEKNYTCPACGYKGERINNEICPSCLVLEKAEDAILSCKYEEAFQLCQEALKYNSPNVYILLGDIYDADNSPYHDPEKAFQYYVKAVESGDIYAYSKLGFYYLYGDKNIRDEEKGIACIKLDIQYFDEPGSLYFLGHYYIEQGKKDHLYEAIHLLERAANKGLKEACDELCGLYYINEWIEADFDLSFKWAKKGALLNSGFCQSILGAFYGNPELKCYNRKKSFKYYTLAAMNDHPLGHHGLGLCYLNGVGVEINYDRGIKELKLAVEEGVPDSMRQLALCYQIGKGVRKNAKKAFKYYQDAVDNGLVAAYLDLSMCYMTGDGVEKDEKKAFQLLKKGVSEGDAECMCMLGYCYAIGSGTKQNYKKSEEYFSKAHDAGSELLDRIMEELEQQGLSIYEDNV